MHLGRSPRRLFAGIVCSAIAVSTLPAMAAAQPESSTTAISEPSITHAAVTLLTGDVVAIDSAGTGQPTVTIHPAPRTDIGVGFQTWHSDEGDTFVIPHDVAALVPDVLDLALFNVSGLIAAGYDDASRDTLPLILQGRDSGAVHTLNAAEVLPAVDSTLSLPVIDAVAAEVTKATAPELGDTLAALADGSGASDPAVSAATAIEKVWLDTAVDVAEWDRNLDQISAPTAWDTGLSGTGVSVAVLDTGVDIEHPDLTGVVTAAENFTAADSAADGHGHGTHVASVIAGSGAAADGARRGVAHGAQLLAGKVLGDDGRGQVSWLIEGMQWAVDQGADIVNLSLGTPAGDEDDPVAQALDRLAQESDTLFVVAAGNSGPDAGTVESPGIAAHALTVGAVDADDRLTGFSSTGPTRGSGRLKPEIVAPGSEIVGARAGGGTAEPYTAMSGTSQAAPHVAGAAALLRERHPHLGWAQLRSALVGTAVPVWGSRWQQGGGRIDLESAVTTSLVADVDTLDLGVLRAESSDPIRVDVTLTNLGEEPAELTVTDEIADADLVTVPAELVTVSPATVALAPGESTQVTVTLAQEGLGAGQFSGTVTVSGADGAMLHIPTGFLIEPERHELRVSVLDRRGEPLSGGVVEVLRGEDFVGGFFPAARLDEHGQAVLDVVPGHYSVMARVTTPARGGEAETLSVAGTAELLVEEDTEYVVDARRAERMRAMTVQGVPTTPLEGMLGYSRGDGSRSYTALMFPELSAFAGGQVFAQPTRPVTSGMFRTEGRWRLESQRRLGDRQEIYDLVSVEDHYPSPPSSVLTWRESLRLARVETVFEAPAEAEYLEYRSYHTPFGGTAIIWLHDLPVPGRRTELISVDPSVTWQQCVIDPAELTRRVCDRHDPAYREGEWRTSTWRSRLTPVTRSVWQGDAALVADIHFGNGAHGGLLEHEQLEETTLRLYRDEELVGERQSTYGHFFTSPEEASFRLELDATVADGVLPAGARTSTAWEFRSHGPTEDTMTGFSPALLDLDYRPDVDEFGRARSGRALPMSLRVDSSGPDRARPAMSRVRLWISTDGGRRWHEQLLLPGLDGARHTVIPALRLRNADAVSTRVAATAKDGRTIEQTVIDAVPLY
ncbi:S8 family serine peptidase [Actinoalloteichus sp. GBA129-24]|uniref:S8 family serine peptidase n=1 Tax=Actinoalloteichus sp. GBA129-24 TaxID=1612551 RepID=UPI00095096B2|nr:S8 family serine peptidase [Actinoalloteichus sp. GBA129-24]APU22869.1 subtilisin-like serine protease [Actinoalloteichus sp. GBA129-24]